MEQFNQPMPVPNDEPCVQVQVMDDMRDRLSHGIEQYGTGLQPFNKRNAPLDAYEEALDKLVYVKQWVIERERIVEAFRAIQKSSDHATAKLLAIQMLLNMGEQDE